MTPAAQKNRPAAERVDRLRDEIAAARRGAPQDDENVQAAARDVEAAQEALRANPNVDETHPQRAARLANAERRYRQAMSAVAAAADQRAAELQRELAGAERDAARETGQAWLRMVATARERSAADTRTIEHAASDYDQIRAGLCRILLDDPDVRHVVEAARAAPVGPGEFVVVAVGEPSERRPDDRRPITVMCHMRDVGNAMIVLPLDQLERLPDGVKGR